ncbi:MAG: hypothetical protein IKZ84_18010 [Victivallales bacterium]|nr:hypothetical protein [Victivallales bacterium]
MKYSLKVLFVQDAHGVSDTVAPSVDNSGGKDEDAEELVNRDAVRGFRRFGG